MEGLCGLRPAQYYDGLMRVRSNQLGFEKSTDLVQSNSVNASGGRMHEPSQFGQRQALQMSKSHH